MGEGRLVSEFMWGIAKCVIYLQEFSIKGPQNQNTASFEMSKHKAMGKKSRAL